jgi:hypothetical protein
MELMRKKNQSRLCSYFSRVTPEGMLPYVLKITMVIKGKERGEGYQSGCNSGRCFMIFLGPPG